MTQLWMFDKKEVLDEQKAVYCERCLWVHGRVRLAVTESETESLCAECAELTLQDRSGSTFF